MHRIYSDFNGADPQGRLRLHGTRTRREMSDIGLEFREGLVATFYDDMLSVEGRMTFSVEEGIWVAEFDWGAVVDEVRDIS